MGCHIGSTAAGQAHRPAQQLDAVARPLGDLHVPERQPADPLHGHIRRVHLTAEGQIRQDTDFPPGVDALHVCGGVCLRVTLLLRLFQGVCKGGAGPDHPGEDIIGGAV